MNKVEELLDDTILSLVKLKTDPVSCYSEVSANLSKLVKIELHLHHDCKTKSMQLSKYEDKLKLSCASKDDNPMKDAGISKMTSEIINSFVNSTETSIQFRGEIYDLEQSLKTCKQVKDYLFSTLDFIKYYMVRVEVLRSPEDINLKDLERLIKDIRDNIIK